MPSCMPRTQPSQIPVLQLYLHSLLNEDPRRTRNFRVVKRHSKRRPQLTVTSEIAFPSSLQMLLHNPQTSFILLLLSNTMQIEK